jgi:hypothetical protein
VYGREREREREREIEKEFKMKKSANEERAHAVQNIIRGQNTLQSKIGIYHFQQRGPAPELVLLVGCLVVLLYLGLPIIKK